MPQPQQETSFQQLCTWNLLSAVSFIMSPSTPYINLNLCFKLCNQPKYITNCYNIRKTPFSMLISPYLCFCKRRVCLKLASCPCDVISPSSPNTVILQWPHSLIGHSPPFHLKCLLTEDFNRSATTPTRNPSKLIFSALLIPVLIL